MSAPGSVRPPRTLGEARTRRRALSHDPAVVRTTVLPWHDVAALGELCDRRDAALAHDDHTTAQAAARELDQLVLFLNQPGHVAGSGPALGSPNPAGLDDTELDDTELDDTELDEDDEEIGT